MRKKLKLIGLAILLMWGMTSCVGDVNDASTNTETESLTETPTGAETESATEAPTEEETEILTDAETETAEHQHQWGLWTNDPAGTCTEGGLRRRSCACGQEETEEIRPKGHTFPATWTVETPPRVESDGCRVKTCTICGDVLETEILPALIPSEGLVFTSHGDGTCYVSGRGTCTDVQIHISPRSPEGDRVTGIGAKAFQGCDDVEMVSIPNGVTLIGDSAFQWCDRLTEISLPDSVTRIESSAFYGCIGLFRMTLPDSVVHVGSGAFAECTQMTEVTLSRGLTCIEPGMFFLCSGLQSVVIPDGVTKISVDAFFRCSSLTRITIPASVTCIGDSALALCESLTRITYRGTVAQWEAIEKEENWDTNTWHYKVYCRDGEIEP